MIVSELTQERLLAVDVSRELAARSDQFGHRLKGPHAVGRVVKHLIGHDEIEAAGSERRIEDVALDVVEVRLLGVAPVGGRDALAEVHAHHARLAEPGASGGAQAGPGAGVEHAALVGEEVGEPAVAVEPETFVEPLILEVGQLVLLVLAILGPLGSEAALGRAFIDRDRRILRRNHPRHPLTDREARAVRGEQGAGLHLRLRVAGVSVSVERQRSATRGVDKDV